MPLLTTSRLKRQARGLVAAAVFVGALSGPVGVAGAGAPATISGQPLTTDLLGTHPGPALTELVKPTPAKQLSLLPGTLPAPTKGKSAKAQRLSGCGGTQYGGGFTTQLASTWTSLVARSQACTGSTSQGTWSSGVTFSVSRETVGQFICKGSTYGYGSSVWFKTSKGWSWSGGTANPRWNENC